ncbi:MAG: hypothetical protein AAFU49_22925 [Pseudomonadota bacterium]
MMKKSDIGQIKLGSAAMTKKWWQSKRAIVAQGCGVGKALDAFNTHCKGKPETILDDDGQFKAKKAAWDLVEAAEKARKKCGKLAKDTGAACQKYMDIAGDYHGRIGQDQGTNRAIGTEIDKATKTITEMASKMVAVGKAFGVVEKRCALTAKQAKSGSKEDVKHHLGTLDGCRNEWGALAKSTDRELSVFVRVGNEVEALAKKMGGTQHVAELTKFRKLVEQTNRTYEDLLTKKSNADEAIRETEKIVNGTDTDVRKRHDEIETGFERIWANPVGSPEKLNKTMAGHISTLKKIIEARKKPLTDEQVDTLREQMRKLHGEAIKIEANSTTFVRQVKKLGDDIKKVPADPKLNKRLKEVAAALQVLGKAKQEFDRLYTTAETEFATLA